MNADPESQSLLAQILLLIILTLINAFFSCFRDCSGFDQ